MNISQEVGSSIVTSWCGIYIRIERIVDCGTSRATNAIRQHERNGGTQAFKALAHILLKEGTTSQSHCRIVWWIMLV